MATTCTGGGSPHALATPVTLRAKHRKAAPSGSCATCTCSRPGVACAPCTTQRGQEPPNRANGKPAPENRLLTLPAGSMRRKKNGTPRWVGRCKEDRRWHACSNDTPKRRAIASTSCRSSRAVPAKAA